MAEVTVLDGGMGRELARIGAPFRQPEWSALALLEDPESVRAAHRNFLEAGAQVLIVNSYAVVPFHLGEERFAARGRELVELAARIAREVADEADREVRVAGCIPPMFGSYEPHAYDPERGPAMYRDMVAWQAPWVDLFVGETISSGVEARDLGAAVAEVAPGAELWLSFALDNDLRDDRPALWSGERVPGAAATALAAGADVVLFNCCRPAVIGPALDELVDTLGAGSSVRVGAYANAFARHAHEGDEYTANTTILDMDETFTPEACVDYAVDWVERGATIVGGCCGVHPDHIAALAARFG